MTPVTSDSGNTILADETVNNGGGGEGFTPHELLAAALASCTVITLRMYANRKVYPLDTIQVEVGIEHESNDSTLFRRTISFTGELKNDEKTRLIQIAEKCPVHKTLINAVRIETILV